MFLGNILTFFAHGLILRKFFKERILLEEKTLYHFFKEDYLEYAKKTP